LPFAAAIAVTGMALSGAPASAAPINPCDLAFSFVCRFLPIAPELDSDVDLSTQLPPAAGRAAAARRHLCSRLRVAAGIWKASTEGVTWASESRLRT
jgi:hypothetical protein